jgi:hypothetical protein
MRRLLPLAVFGLLLWQIGAPDAWSRRNPVPADEYAFEASRRGFQPVEYPGPLTREDFLTILLRREGDWRIPVTINYREWRMAAPPDLWESELPGVMKLRISDQAMRLARAPSELRLSADETYNLPLLVRNDSGEPADLKTIALLRGEAFADRFELRPGLNYLLVNLRPTAAGRADLEWTAFVGKDAPPEGSPRTASRMPQPTVPRSARSLGAAASPFSMDRASTCCDCRPARRAFGP